MTKRNSKRKIDKNEQDILWWNNLDSNWKEEFISNLLQSPDYKDKEFSKNDILEKVKISQIITDIVNLKKLNISRKVVSDLTPIFYLENIEEFHICEPDWEDPNAAKIIESYPKHLRSKVKRLSVDGIRLGELTPSGDFTIFENFINLESIQIQSCQFESLNGIEKLKKLKSLMGGMNNYFSDLNPLRGLPIKYLDLEWTKVKDLSPLIDVQTLEYLILNCLGKILDYSVLFHLPNLITVIFNNWIEVESNELKDFLMANYNTDENGIINSHLKRAEENGVQKNLSIPANDKLEIPIEIREPTDELPF